MSPYVSWGILLTIVSAYVVYSRVNKPQKKEDVIIQKGSALLGLGKESGTESTSEKKKKKKKPAKKAAKPEATPEPTPVATPKEEKKEAPAKKKKQQPKKAEQPAAPVVKQASPESDDEAVEEDAATMARHMAQFRAGGKSPAPAAAAQSNGSGSERPKVKGKKSKVAEFTQGSDADAEDERWGSSTNPSDMLEPETSGPGVLRITPSQQPQRVQKPRTVSQQSTEGVHASKNQKKRERQKAAKAEEQRLQELAREKYRAEQKAELAKGPAKPQPVNALAGSSAWADSSKTEKAVKKSPATGLLDTFEPSNSTLLDDGSLWEKIPANLVDDGWQEVAVKKKPAKENKDDGSSDEEISTSAAQVAPVEVTKPKVRDPAVLKQQYSKNKNPFHALSDSTQWEQANGWEQEASL
ncbi:hypothetical protein BJ508DRAFT_326128 [Ascobolus immersus RN42]|uniref:Inner centromere protein ARK-binding domain-containing protein n=1 Tax=Ascobolus immersus RN42 TaxID=1160509 RepID=A0A3N4I6E5_ASCIM|nr:hypothetical protein BJ508DRAFT_326128 [Ascobolus immersus RN42]